MSQNVRNVLITQCVVNWNWDKLVQNASSIHYWPFGSVLRENTNKVELVLFICVVEFLIDDSTSQNLGLVDPFSISFVLDNIFLTLLDDWSEGLFVGILFWGVNKNVLHSLLIFSWRVNKTRLEGREPINSSLSLFFLCYGLSV